MTIKDICEKYRLSQTALAKRFGIPLRTVQDWHGRRRNPPDYVVGMMMELLEKDRIETNETE
jgi:DNA-binding transcriptional regulator YiaG